MTKRFDGKKIKKNSLKKYGFVIQDGVYEYRKEILDGQFQLTVYISPDNTLTTKLIDSFSDDLYTLHLVEGASGKFIGKIREEYDKILDSILENCYENTVFKEDITLKMLEYIEKEYGSKPEYLWKQYPDNAIVRHKENKKWFGAILTVGGNKLGLPTDKIVEVINLKMSDINKVVDNEKYFAAYHMNKKMWISALLNNNTDFEELKKLIQESYELTL